MPRVAARVEVVRRCRDPGVLRVKYPRSKSRSPLAADPSWVSNVPLHQLNVCRSFKPIGSDPAKVGDRVTLLSSTRQPQER